MQHKLRRLILIKYYIPVFYYYTVLRVFSYECYTIKFAFLKLDIPFCFRIIKEVRTVNTTVFAVFVAINTTHITQLYLQYLLQ